MDVHFLEIEFASKKTAATYRFYGRGKWKIKDGAVWRVVNAIYVPGDVLNAAAEQCNPAPPLVLTEIRNSN